MEYPIPDEKGTLKLSQYANDTNFFVITENSIVEILKLFRTYELATGAIINISKTKITPLANAKIYNVDQKVQNIDIKKPTEFVKIFDIHFNNNLQETSNYNWNKCLLKMLTNKSTVQKTPFLERKSRPVKYNDSLKSNFLRQCFSPAKTNTKHIYLNIFGQ